MSSWPGPPQLVTKSPSAGFQSSQDLAKTACVQQETNNKRNRRMISIHTYRTKVLATRTNERKQALWRLWIGKA